MSRRRVALLGGSFDPPHLGHLMAAVFVRSALGADEVWLVPSATHPFQKAMTGYAHRVAMCEAMAAEVGPWLTVSGAETEVPGDGRTVDLLEHLVPRHPGVEFSLVIGSDILGELPRWKAWDRIEALVQVVVLHRAGFPDPRAVGPPLAGVSSSQIRARLAAGEPVLGLVPRVVAAYIQGAGLYRPSNDAT